MAKIKSIADGLSDLLENIMADGVRQIGFEELRGVELVQNCVR